MVDHPNSSDLRFCRDIFMFFMLKNKLSGISYFLRKNYVKSCLNMMDE